MNRLLALACLLLCVASASVAEVNAAPVTQHAAISRVRDGIQTLNRRFWSPVACIWFDGKGFDPRAYFERRQNAPWWPSANGVELLIDYMNVSGTTTYDADVAALYTLQKDADARRTRVIAELKRLDRWSDEDEQRFQKATVSKQTRSSGGYYSDFQNEYLDDSGWWGVTWLKMYDRTGDAKYLETAKTIHAHIAKNWHPDKGGGVLWCEDEDKQRPNAITNSLFLILSSRLHQATGDRSYLDWAAKTVDWCHSVELYDGTGIVDGPHHLGDYWSYNQGAYIGGLCALYQTTGTRAHLDEASKVAESVLDRAGFLSSEGVIVEKMGTRGDAALFKGIFVRYLAQLRDMLAGQKLHPEVAAKINRATSNSAAALMQIPLGPEDLYPADWRPGAVRERSDFETQLSALIALLIAS